MLGWVIRALLPMGILFAGWYGYSVLSIEVEKEKTPAAAAQPLRTQVIELSACDYPVKLRTHGTVQACNSVPLSSMIAGQIVRVAPAFEVGAYFDEGDVLLELDDRDYVNAVTIAEGRVQSTGAAMRLAEQNEVRTRQLYQQIASSESEMDQIHSLKLQASAEHEIAKAQWERAKRDLERTKVIAPFDGRVRSRSVGLGQTIGVGTPLGEVFSVDYAEVRLPVAANELPFLELPEDASDSPIEVELFDAVSQSQEPSWRGRIVRTEGTLDLNSLELYAIARIQDPFRRQSEGEPLRIGQPVVALIAGKVLEGVEAIPRGAVRQLNQIYLVDKEKLTLESRSIEAIWSDRDVVIVRDPSLTEGVYLSTTQLVYAPNGAKVELLP